MRFSRRIASAHTCSVHKSLAENGLLISSAEGTGLCCRYGENLIPDVWFDAKAVWEVKAADLSVSPVHCAALGLVDPSKGVSIRFPRLVSHTVSATVTLSIYQAQIAKQTEDAYSRAE